MSEEQDTLKVRARKEKTKIKRLLKRSGVADDKIKMLDPVIDNTAWMKAKLEDAIDGIRNGFIVTEYDNGGGQKGIRENPLFKAYESLFKTYMAGMGKIIDAMPDKKAGAAPDEVKPQTVLDAILARKAK